MRLRFRGPSTSSEILCKLKMQMEVVVGTLREDLQTVIRLSWYFADQKIWRPTSNEFGAGQIGEGKAYDLEVKVISADRTRDWWLTLSSFRRLFVPCLDRGRSYVKKLFPSPFPTAIGLFKWAELFKLIEYLWMYHLLYPERNKSSTLLVFWVFTSWNKWHIGDTVDSGLQSWAWHFLLMTVKRSDHTVAIETCIWLTVTAR